MSGLLRRKACVFILMNLFMVGIAGGACEPTTPYQRIVSLAPNITELLFTAGAGSHVVAVDSASNYPPQVKRLPHVANMAAIDQERLLSLSPDLVLTWRMTPQLAQLQTLGIKVIVVHIKTIDQIPKMLERLGCLAGSVRTAHVAAKQFRDRYQALQQRYQHQRPVRVFLQLWQAPLMTVNGESLISQVVSLCGGKNTFARAFVSSPQVDRESVIARHPDVIIATAGQAHWKIPWLVWGSVPAVKHDQLYTVPADQLDRAGPRLMQAANQICIALATARRVHTTA